MKITPGEKITLGFYGRKLIYKAMGEIVHILSVKNSKKKCFEVGIKLTGIHQELR
ncbi:hypothetical protein WDW89_11965 [Deltaproteobacteria bacterium TL4]